MTIKAYSALLCVVLSALPLFSTAQTAFDSPLLNRSVLRHFPGEQLKQIELNDPERFGAIHTYFTQSFSVELISCKNCALDYNTFFNQELFDVSNYETQRLETEPVSFEFNDRYLVTLLPKENLSSVLGGIGLQGLFAPQLPKWLSTGNDLIDYKKYKQSVEEWASTYPEEYRRITRSESLYKISIDAFLALAEERKEHVLSQPGGYLLID
ncbi:MAG: hypothetical protein QNK23_01920 [Crocinitomicaceae bacterium]|nr:hypothetical protein [Crocinitomicaceae bacterium]